LENQESLEKQEKLERSDDLEAKKLDFGNPYIHGM
jgi:hypothetical protein